MLVYFFYEFIGAGLLPFLYIAVLGISPHDIPPDTIHATAEKNDGANGQKFVVCYTFFVNYTIIQYCIKILKILLHYAI